jgi:hypothetical protein
MLQPGDLEPLADEKVRPDTGIIPDSEERWFHSQGCGEI